MTLYEILITWGIVAPPVAYLVGSALRKLDRGLVKSAPKEMPPVLRLVGRAEQHKYDAAHNPNYRGGYTP